jgi:hypothetical protein
LKGTIAPSAKIQGEAIGFGNPATMQTSTFNQVLENIESLSIEDQEALMELMQRRFVERRRAEIAVNIAQAKEEYQADQVFRGTFDEAIAELNQRETL